MFVAVWRPTWMPRMLHASYHLLRDFAGIHKTLAHLSYRSYYGVPFKNSGPDVFYRLPYTDNIAGIKYYPALLLKSPKILLRGCEHSRFFGGALREPFYGFFYAGGYFCRICGWVIREGFAQALHTTNSPITLIVEKQKSVLRSLKQKSQAKLSPNYPRVVYFSAPGTKRWFSRHHCPDEKNGS
mgnify:FL=1